MEYNKSLSARIRRRNKQGFSGNGTGLGFSPYNKTYGDYTDPICNHKLHNYLIDKRRKNYNRSKGYVSYTKKYADGKQKFIKLVKNVFKLVKDYIDKPGALKNQLIDG